MFTKSSFRSQTLEARTLLALMIHEVLERARWAPAQVDEALAALQLDRDVVRHFDVLLMREIVSLALQILAEVTEPEQIGPAGPAGSAPPRVPSRKRHTARRHRGRTS